MDTYAHLFPGQDAGAVAALPSMMNGPQDAPEALQATGTDDGAAATGSRSGSTPDAKPFTKAAGTYKADKNTQNATDGPNVLRIKGLRGEKRESARRNESRPGGIRTPDQGIMSPLLSPLSYGPLVFAGGKTRYTEILAATGAVIKPPRR